MKSNYLYQGLAIACGVTISGLALVFFGWPQVSSAATYPGYPIPQPVNPCGIEIIITSGPWEAQTEEHKAKVLCLQGYRDQLAAWKVGADAHYNAWFKEVMANSQSPFVVGGSPVTPAPTPTPTPTPVTPTKPTTQPSTPTDTVSALVNLITLLQSNNPPTYAEVEKIVNALQSGNGSGATSAVTSATAKKNIDDAAALLVQAKAIAVTTGQKSTVSLSEEYLTTANAQFKQSNFSSANGTALAVIALLKTNFPTIAAGTNPPFVIGPTQPTTPTTGTLTQNLSRGDSGAEVLLLQAKLEALGYLEKESLSGFFGPLTEAAVQKFQCEKGIVCAGTPSTTGYGMVGPSTRAAFNGTATPMAPMCAYESFVIGPAPACTPALEDSTQYGSRCTCKGTNTTTLKYEVSNSLSGPWTTNGAVCNDVGRTVYTRLTGVTKSNPPKGCADLTSGTACLDTSKHRSFTEAEWPNSTTIQTVLSGGLLQNGAFSTYISYPGTGATKVGSFELKQCAASTAPVCAYEGAVFGGSPQCTKAIEGSTQYGSRCTCKSASQIFVIGPSSEGSTQPKSSGVGIAYSEHIAKAGGYYTSMGGWIPVETSGWYDVTNNKWISFDGSPTPAGVQQMIDARGN